MRAVKAISALAFAGHALGHGYVYRITADNTVYPGWDVFLDASLSPTPNRIAYGDGQTGPVASITGNDMACGAIHTPAPGAIAEVRAGSNITFHWSRWLYSHKGPITAWMAPYDGDVSNADVNKLQFFKFAEDTMDANGIWGTVRMLNTTNGTWTATVPADIKPGNYVVRHEIIALHFAISTPPGFEGFSIGPQFYMTCFNIKVTGDGTATPKGMTFPGAYKKDDPGLHYDLKTGNPYPTLGPALYSSTFNVTLAPKAPFVVSPTGKGTDADTTYLKNQDKALAQQGQVTEYFDSIGG